MIGHDPTDIAGQQRAAEELAIAQAKAAAMAAEDLKWVLSDKRGRRFIWGLLQAGGSGVFHETFNVDALLMARNEGRRYQALQLLTRVMRAAPGRYEEMVRENLNDD